VVSSSLNVSFPEFDKEGHRGCRGLMPENTIPAILKAIDLGVTTLEMDVVFTKDNEAILSHEPFFNHEITTKPGGGFIAEAEERGYNIYQMTFKETQQYDVGLKPNPRFPLQQKLPVHKPALTDVIDSAEHYVSEKHLPKIFYNIETKTALSTDNIYHPAPEQFVDLLMKIIFQRGITERVIIQSFDFRTLQILHRKYPQVKTSMLIEDSDKRLLREQLKQLGFTPTIYSPEFSLVSASLIRECHRHSIKVVPWTVNEKNKIEELKKLGVDGVITDFPDLFSR
jgi:glycerophosphoryl diester phosphodiesterase